MTMDPKDQKPELNPGGDWEQDLEMIWSALPELESVEPPDLLDQSVLNAARRELTATRRRPVRWFGGLATAAVVVLALSIVIQQDQKTADLQRRNEFQLNATRPTAAEKQSPVAASAISELPLASPPVAPAVANDEALEMNQQRVEIEKLRDTAGSVSASSPSEVDHMAKRSLMKVNEDLDSHSLGESGVEESSVPFEDDKFDSPVVSSRNTDRSREQFEETELSFSRTDSSLREKTEVSSDVIISTPEAWIEYMLELQKAKRHEDLKSELEAFRKAYPAFPLPAELKD